MSDTESVFELDLNVTQSQHDSIPFSDVTYAEKVSWIHSSNVSSSQSSLCLYMEENIDFYDPKAQILSYIKDIVSCRKIQRCYRAYKHRKRVRIFTNKMKARKRLGCANVIKRCIVRKGMRRRSTNALRLYRLFIIGERLQRKKSIYY
jgi:hypothetical protein